MGAGAFGAGAGRGPGVGPAEGVLLLGAAGASGACGASGAAGAGAAGPGLGAPGFGAAGRAACAGEGADGDGFAGADLRGAAGLPAARPLPLPAWKASVSLRTTGASIVEDAERTNSPSSWSLAMTTLLSTPNSLASSYTRTLATSLLLGPGCPPDRRYFMGVLIAYSSSAHRNLDLLPTREVPDRTVFRALCVSCCALVQGRLLGSLDVVAQGRRVERSPAPKSPGKSPAANRQVEADQCRVHISTPAGQRTARIGGTLTLHRHDAQQIALGRSLPASQTGSLRACAGMRPARHCLSLPPRGGLTPMG